MHINTKRVTSEDRDFQLLVSLLDRELAIRDGDAHSFYSQFNKIDTIRHAIVCYIDVTPAGCGAFRPYDTATAEIKRMYVLPEFRRQGVAAAVLSELESWAADAGYTTYILETGKKQPEAIGLYLRSRYTIIPNYGQYEGVANSVCMSKKI